MLLDIFKKVERFDQKKIMINIIIIEFREIIIDEVIKLKLDVFWKCNQVLKGFIVDYLGFCGLFLVIYQDQECRMYFSINGEFWGCNFNLLGVYIFFLIVYVSIFLDVCLYVIFFSDIEYLDMLGIVIKNFVIR